MIACLGVKLPRVLKFLSRLTRAFLITILGFFGQQALAQQVCIPMWTSYVYNTQFVSTLSAVDAGTQGILPGYDPATHPGVSLSQPATCSITYGDEALGTAVYSCSEAYTCEPITCTVFQSGNATVIVNESCQAVFYVRVNPAVNAETRTANSVSDPINPATGNVFDTEDDLAPRTSSLAFSCRYYNSVDTNGAGLGIGWRHSYSRSISSVLTPWPYAPISAAGGAASATQTTPGTACSYGFTQIRAQVPAWASASASDSNGICTLTSQPGTLGTLAGAFERRRFPLKPRRLSTT